MLEKETKVEKEKDMFLIPLFPLGALRTIDKAPWTFAEVVESGASCLSLRALQNLDGSVPDIVVRRLRGKSGSHKEAKVGLNGAIILSKSRDFFRDPKIFLKPTVLEYPKSMAP